MIKTSYNIGCKILFLVLLLTKHVRTEIKGPPHADKSVVQVIGHIGETLRIPCPINGYPVPMIEWSKDGETINDYSWDRYRVVKKFLKIRKAHLKEDTDVFICKGINGFGSVSVRIEVIIVDPKQFSPSKDGSSIDVAPPVFTDDTRAIMDKRIRKNLDEIFEVSCEALGSPVPRIAWFKNGRPLEDFGDGLKGRGRQSIKYRLGPRDGGNYSCKAWNLISETEIGFTLDVITPEEMLHHQSHRTTTELTGDGPSNKTVLEGSSASMTCRVRSDSTPHIQWLKKLDPSIRSVSFNEDTVEVGNERYQILKSDKNIIIGNGEFLNELTISRTKSSDTGMYICFVTNSGFRPLTYKSAFLEVIPDKGPYTDESMPILISVISLSIFVFLLLIIIMVCVVRNRKGLGGKSSSPTDESSVSDHESHRPFISSHHHHHLPYNHSRVTPGCSQTLNKLEAGRLQAAHQGSLPPLTGTAWSIYPSNYHQKYSTGSSSHDTTLSSTHYESPSSKLLLDHRNSRETVNQYEVPFGHLLSGKNIPGSSPPPPLPPPGVGSNGSLNSVQYPPGRRNLQYMHYFNDS